MERYSKKRQAIVECLSATKSHPTAEQIYAFLKPSLPDLSLATVYRNLAHLKETGRIRSVGIVNGQERFDADVTPHAHAVCRVCGRVTDLAGLSVPGTLLTEVEAIGDFCVSDIALRFDGLCRACLAREKA